MKTRTAATAMAAAVAVLIPGAAHGHPTATRVTCAMRSAADFPNAYADPHNLVVGPLAIVGAGGPTSADTVARFGGNKFPVLVKPGHTVTVGVLPSLHGAAALAYGPNLVQGRSLTVRDGFQTETFVACGAGKPDSSTANGPVTFWSGFVLVDGPVCVRLDVSVDDRPAQRADIAMGAPCATAREVPHVR